MSSYLIFVYRISVAHSNDHQLVYVLLTILPGTKRLIDANSISR